MFRIVAEISVKKDIKKLDKVVQKKIREEIFPKIEMEWNNVPINPNNIIERIGRGKL